MRSIATNKTGFIRFLIFVFVNVTVEESRSMVASDRRDGQAKSLNSLVPTPFVCILFIYLFIYYYFFCRRPRHEKSSKTKYINALQKHLVAMTRCQRKTMYCKTLSGSQPGRCTSSRKVALILQKVREDL